MIRAVVAAGILVPLFLPAPQELKLDVLDKLKAATVYVVVDHPARRGSGSGFLFLKRGSSGYLLTNEHVVGLAPTVKVVFWSGTAKEKSFTARVVATDPSRDIACLLVRDAFGLPAVLELGKKTEVRETETVFAAGFPFGAMLASGNKNPEISISKSSVSSIRRNGDGEMANVQISGEINPGNSGGPLVTGDGRVIGVTTAKILGTQTAFAVPSEQIQGFLQGRVKAASFRKLEGAAAKARYEVVLDLVDPLSTLKSVGIAWIEERHIKGDFEPEKDGTWKKVHSSMRTVSLEIDEDRAVRPLDFAASKGTEDLVIVFQCYHVRADGQTVWTEPSTQDIRFGPGTDRFAGGGRRAPGPAPSEPDEPEPPPAPEPPAGPVVTLRLPDTISVAAQLPLNSVFGGLALSPDGSILYALDLSEAQVYKLDPDTLQIKARLDVSEASVLMTLTPDGTKMYIAGRNPAALQDPNESLPGGSLQVIDTATWAVTSSFDVKAALVEIVATDRGLVAATCRAQWGGFVVIDVARKSEDYVRRIYGGGTIRLARDQRRVYVGDVGLSPGDYHCVPLRKVGGAYASYDSVYHGDHPLGGSFLLSPDGKYLVGGYGSVLRLGRTRESDLKFVSKIDPFQVGVAAAGCGSLFVVSLDGFLKSYALGTFELQKSVPLGHQCDMAVLDPKRRKIHAVLSPKSDQRMPRNHWTRYRVGRLSSLALEGK